MRVWRISNHADLSGEGGLRAAGRWNYRGERIVYCSDHPSTAMLEVLVHFDPEDLPETYQLLEIDIPDDVVPFTPTLADDWRDHPDTLRDIWHDIVSGNLAAVAEVPSVIMPFARNILLNPAHHDHSRLSVTNSTRHLLDPRFLR
ncbi:MAG: RES family NAD+ phosphorylase [Salaquimonas sp.]|nr:RES family NAD+ phosphorylase [Salaquimonas sp.]